MYAWYPTPIRMYSLKAVLRCAKFEFGPIFVGDILLLLDSEVVCVCGRNVDA